jgi:hypothetical protein
MILVQASPSGIIDNPALYRVTWVDGMYHVTSLIAFHQRVSLSLTRLNATR